MNDIVSLDQVRADRQAAQALANARTALVESYRTLAAALSPILDLPVTRACAAGNCAGCSGVQGGILCGHDCGHGFGEAS